MSTFKRPFTLAVSIFGLILLFQNCGSSKFTSAEKVDVSKNSSALGTASLSMADQTYIEGKPASLYVSSSVYLPGATLKWYKDGKLIKETTQYVFTITQSQISDSGTYKVELLADGGLVSDTEATLSVVEDNSAIAPIFNTQPESQDLLEGEELTLSANVTASPDPDLQWQKDGVDIPGATGSSLSISEAAESDSGKYRLRASNKAGEQSSQVATVVVKKKPAPQPPQGSGVGGEATPNNPGYCYYKEERLGPDLKLFLDPGESYDDNRCVVYDNNNCVPGEPYLIGYDKTIHCTPDAELFIENKKCYVRSYFHCGLSRGHGGRNGSGR